MPGWFAKLLELLSGRLVYLKLPFPLFLFFFKKKEENQGEGLRLPKKKVCWDLLACARASDADRCGLDFFSLDKPGHDG
jgi:hypothetical protein